MLCRGAAGIEPSLCARVEAPELAESATLPSLDFAGLATKAAKAGATYASRVY